MMRHTVLLTTGVVSALAGPLCAAEEWTWALPQGHSLSFYGQSSPTTQTVDDGVSSYVSVRDNSHATTRLGFNLTRSVGASVIRWIFESGFAIPTTDGNSQSSANDRWAWGEPTIRKAEVSFSIRMGDWSLGQGAMATDGVATQDLSGTDVVGSSTIRDDAGSFQFRSRKTGELTDIKLGEVFGNFDGSRRIRVRYDTPPKGGYTLAVAVGIDDFREETATFADLAMRFERDYAAIRIRGAGGLSWQQEDGEEALNWLGSISAFHPESGANVTTATGFQVNGGKYAYLKAGYRISPFRFGDTKAAVDLFLGRDYETEGSRSRSVGLQIVQAWEKRNIDAYIGYRHYHYSDRTPDEYRSAQSTLAGLRWRF